jgi:hypothetical protein
LHALPADNGAWCSIRANGTASEDSQLAPRRRLRIFWIDRYEKFVVSRVFVEIQGPAASVNTETDNYGDYQNSYNGTDYDPPCMKS